MGAGKGRYAALREEALAANLEIPRLSLAILTWGNASAFDPKEGVFAIKPSGVEYSDLRDGDMVVVDLEGKVVEGSLRPSSDTKTHQVLYREFAGIRGICHTHSTFATAWAQTRRPIPCLGTTHADQVAGPVPCTEMIPAADVERDYELGTGELIARTLAGKPPLETPMILVAGHGPFAWGSSAMKAVHGAAALEEVAHLAFITFMVEEGTAALPDYVVRKHYERKHGAQAYYGQAGR
jgi:L-ribulose-5-phosphate 4-epimerase